MNKPCIVTVAFILGTAVSGNAPADSPSTDFAFRDNDRVVLLGSDFIERLQIHGYLETAITENSIHLSPSGEIEIVAALLPKLNIPSIAFDSLGLQALRTTIRHKNDLFFHRYRPQNETYLFFFRKHEQGHNAIEIPQFDPLIAAKEQEIARMKQPAR